MITALEKFARDQKNDTLDAINDLRKTFGTFTVYFLDHSQFTITDKPVYTFVKVVGNFGGLLGLYLGFSTLTVMELVDFMFDVKEYFQVTGKRHTLRKKNKNGNLNRDQIF
ncbi:acid-sensing ion channel 4-B-like [Convolutriloba macropyga]|uniref:acid-sensing ion channel 4-B-like n=1 Tax=Convolutriloba macropyga TaxID=536237 RepID=UPI003F51F3A5